jgi:hypothetical protein
LISASMKTATTGACAAARLPPAACIAAVP